MTSLYVDRSGMELRVDGGALAFYENGERRGTVPIAPLDRVYLHGDVFLQSSVLGKLGEHGVGLVILSGRKSEPTMLMGKPHNDAARRVAQYHLSQDAVFCLEFSRQLVALKLREQAALLTTLREKDEQARYALTLCARQVTEAIDKVGQQNSIAALRGLEGHAAAVYFAGLAAHMMPNLGFKGRNRRPPRDPLNVVLSLGYTLLHADTVLALYGAGLDPYVGFYHGLNFGRESLASDVMEPLRPRLDQFAVQLFKSGELRAEDFSTTAQGCLMGKAGRVRFYPLYEAAAEDFRARLTERIGELLAAVKASGLSSSPQRRSAPVDSDADADGDWDDDA